MSTSWFMRRQNGFGHAPPLARIGRAACLSAFYLLATATPAGAEQSGDYTYTVSNGQATITGFSPSYSGDLSITNNLDGYPVVSIGAGAFSFCTHLAGVTIPDGVTSIGESAFFFCPGLTDITIPDSVTSIGDSAFYQCAGLTDVTIPDGVTVIGDTTFHYCTSLTNAVIGNGVVRIGMGAFSGCSRLTSFTVGDSNAFFSSAEGVLFDKGRTSLLQCPWGKAGMLAIPSGVTSIEDSAVQYCTRLTGVTIPDSVISVGESSFYSCTGLITAVIGNGVARIGNSAFRECTGLTSVKIPGSVTGIGEYAFCSCKGLTNAVIGNGVAYIGNGAFELCVRLASVIVPDTVITIGEYAFYACTGLTNAVVGHGVSSIGKSAFQKCTGLTNVTLGRSVTSLGQREFDECISLVAFNVDPDNASYCSAEGVLLDKNLTTLFQYPLGKAGSYRIPSSVAHIAVVAFQSCRYLTDITIPDKVASIGSDTFYACIGLTNAVIGNGVVDIGNNAFKYCTGLANVTIGSSVTRIGDNAFSHCDSLINISMPDGVTSLGDGSFQYCESLREILIPNSVTSIGSAAFEGCISLTNAVIGRGVTSISADTFGSCIRLTSMAISDSVVGIGIGAFRYCESLAEILIPNSVTNIGSFAFYGCNRMTNVVIGAGVISIGFDAFNHCGGLTSVLIPDNVIGIGDTAFYDCTGLTTVTLGRGVTSLGQGVFDACSGLAAIIVELDNASFGSDEGVLFDKSLTELLQCPEGKAGSYIIPNSVTQIEAGAFRFCRRVTDISIPDTVTSIESDTFYACSGLTNAVIGNGVTNIGDWAFCYCSGLTSITFPASVTGIGTLAFCFCDCLSSACFKGDAPALGSDVFFGAGNLTVYRCSGTAGWPCVPNTWGGCPTDLWYPDFLLTVNGGVGGGEHTLGNLVTITATPRVGYAFDRWEGATQYVDNVKSATATVTMPPSDIVLTAVFKGNAYMVAFEPTGGWVSPGSKTVIYGSAYGTLPLPSRTGYTFAGWRTAADGAGTPVSGVTAVEVAADHTLYAQWVRGLPPRITERAPATTLLTVSEGASLGFSVRASDGADPDAAGRGMSNITWLVDGVRQQVTYGGAPNAISSAFAVSTGADTVQGGAAFRFVEVSAVALDRQGLSAATRWTVRVKNVSAAQTVTFKALPPRVLGDPDFVLEAAASSGLPVAFASSNGSVLQIEGGMAHIVGAGTAVITARQPGNADFRAAVPVKRRLTVKARLLAVIPAGGGTVIGAGLYLPGTKISLTAIPATSHTFLQWDDGSQATARRLTMPNANVSVTALFGPTTNVPPPVLEDPGPQTAVVGVAFNLPVRIVSESLPGVTVAGLPTGLKAMLDVSGGRNATVVRIAGVPTAPTPAGNPPARVTVTAANVAERPVTNTFTVDVVPLPAWAQGTFNGVAWRDWHGSGAASMNVTALGGVSGKLSLWDSTYSFSAKSYAFRHGEDAFMITATATVGRASLPVFLVVTLPEIRDPYGIVPATLGLVRENLASDLEVTLYRSVWKEPGMATVLAERFTGYYTATLPAGTACGNGYLAFTVDKAGGVKTAGRLADGTAVSQSGALILNEEGRVFTVISAAPAAYEGGGLFGLVEFCKAAAEEPVILRLLGEFDPLLWENRAPRATSAYGTGFRRELWLDGGWYDTLGNLYRYYTNRTLSVGTDDWGSAPQTIVGTNRHASVWWDPDGIVLSVVTNRNGAMTGLAAPQPGVPAREAGSRAYDYGGVTNAVGLTVALNRATGVFRGSFKAWFDYAATHTSKTIAYAGILTPERADPSDGVAGRGFFLWPDKAQVLNAQGRPETYGFNWSYDLKILLAE